MLLEAAVLFVQPLELDLSPTVRSACHEFGKDEWPSSFLQSPHTGHVSNRCLFSPGRSLPAVLFVTPVPARRFGLCSSASNCFYLSPLSSSSPPNTSASACSNLWLLLRLSTCRDFQYCICREAVHFLFQPFVSVNRLTWSQGTFANTSAGR